jgi:hypothetical protein
MPSNAIGSVDDTGAYANQNMLAEIRDFVDAEGWTILEEDTVSATRHWIAEAPGYTGPDGDVHAYVGMRSYESVGADYYNLSVATFTGYVPGNSFTTQPGYKESGIPAHNQPIDYWMTANERRVAFVLKVGTPVYEHGYAGFMLPYATPRQYPYPIVCGGMLSGIPATRFSETSHGMPYKGNRANFALRWVTGSYLTPYAHPWSNSTIGGSASAIRPSQTYHPLNRVVVHDNAANIYGELDGLYHITGFDNVTENTLSIGGETYLVAQDVWRTGFPDYIALRLEV